MRLILAAVLAASVMAPSMSEAQTLIQQSITGTRLDIQMRGETKAVPDIAVVSAGVVTQAADAQSAMRENATRMAKVVAALNAAGIDDKDIQTTSVNLSPQYRYANNEAPVITGYQANNQVTVRFRDIGKSGAVLDALVRQGANQINGPTLMIDKPEAALDAARVSAMKAARQRADLYAKTVGMTVKRIVSINETIDNPGGPMPMMMQAKGANAEADTSILPGEQSIGVTISVIYELQ